MPLYENKGKYLLVTLNEPYSLNLFLTTINEMAARCEQDGLGRALADVRLVEGNPTIMDRYEMGVEVAKALGSRVKTAAVAETSMINWLAETVAVNRGAHFKVFSELDQALHWLGMDEG